MSPRRTLASALVVVVCGLVLGGCEEFNSRRKINEGNKLFKDGKFEDATEMYESALADRDLDVGHYNLGIAYVKLFIPGLSADKNLVEQVAELEKKLAEATTPEDKTEIERLLEPKRRALKNTEYADKAAMHLAKWLAKNPRDNDIRKLMTSVWVDSGDFEKAIAYWENEHKADPTNRDVIGQLASINLKAASGAKFQPEYFDATIKWILKDAEVAPNPEAKLSAYIGVGRVVWATLSPKEKAMGADRVRVADLGIAILQKGQALDPKNTEVLGLTAAIYNFRALAHGASFASAIDRASAQDHLQKQRVLLEEAKKKKAAEAAGAPPPAEKPGG